MSNRQESALNRKIAAATAAIDATKEKARAELAIAENKLAERIALRDAAPIGSGTRRAYVSAVKVQEYICDQLRGLAA